MQIASPPHFLVLFPSQEFFHIEEKKWKKKSVIGKIKSQIWTMKVIFVTFCFSILQERTVFTIYSLNQKNLKNDNLFSSLFYSFSPIPTPAIYLIKDAEE